MPISDTSKHISDLERRVYTIIQQRARFVGISIDELCRRSDIAPSTFSRWVNGHHGGYIKTIARMDEILTGLETQKFCGFMQRITSLGLCLADVCRELEIPELDYARWAQRELDADYEKLARLEQYLEARESSHHQPKESLHDEHCA